MTLYYVVFDTSANKPVCLESECNNNSVTKSRNRKRKLELETAQNTGNNGDEETEINSCSKKSRSQSYEEIKGSNEEMREELGDGHRSEDNREEINGSQSHLTFAVDSPADSRLYESLEPNTDSNDLNCLNAGDASLAVAENSDIIAHITQNSAFSKTTGFFLQENNMSSDVDLDSSKAVGGFLHSHFVEEMADDRTAESDLTQHQTEDNDIQDLTEQQDLENSVSGQLTPEEIRKASDFYYAHGNAVELRDYFQDDVNPVEHGSGVSAEHWLPTATDAVSQSGETMNETQTEGELSYPVENDPSKDSDAEIDTEIRRIAANVAISDENSMTDYGMNDDSESALPSPYPEPVENTVGDGETGVVGGHRNIMDSIAISQLFSPSSSSSTSVGISVGNFLVQNAPPFEFLVRSDGMSQATLGLNGLALNGHGFPNWADYMDPMQQVQDSSFRIVPTEPGTFPMLNSNFATVSLPFPNLSQSVAESKLLSPGAIPGLGCFPVDSAQNGSVFPAIRDSMTPSANDNDACTNRCTPDNELCSSNKPGSVSTTTLSSSFGVVCNTAIPEVLPVGLTMNDRASSSRDIHCIGAILEVDNIRLSRVQPSKMPDVGSASEQVSTLDQSCAQDEDTPDGLRSAENNDTDAGIFIDSSDRINDNDIARRHANDSAQLCTCESELCSSRENVARQVLDMHVHSVLECSESADSLSSSGHKFSASAINTTTGNSTAISPVAHDTTGPWEIVRTEQQENILESETLPVVLPVSLSSGHSECATKEDSLSLSGTSAENGEAILSKDSFACASTGVDVAQSSETRSSNGQTVSLSLPTSVQAALAVKKIAAVESQTISNTGNSVENNSTPKEIYVANEEGKEGVESFNLQRRPQNETANTKQTITRTTVKSSTAGNEAPCENQPGNKVSVGTQTNIDLLGRYFKRRVNPVNSFLAGKSSRTNNSSSTRDRSSKSAKTGVSVTTSKSTSSTLSSTVNLSTGGSLTSQAAIFHISGHGAPILFPAVSPVTINGKSTFLITVPGNFSFPGQNGVRPNMTLLPTRLNYSNPRSAAIGLSAPLVLHQGTPTSQAMVIGRAVGPPLQLIVPPTVSTTPVFESSKDPQTPTTMMIPGANRPGLVCRFTLNSNQPSCAVSTPTVTSSVSSQAVTSIGSITRSVCTDTVSSVSHSGMQAVLRPGKPGACIVASCSSVPHLSLSAATLPTFVLSNAPPLTFQNQNVLNSDPNPRTENSSTKTPTDASPRASNKSASPISSTLPNITCCSPSSSTSAVQSSGSPISTASVFQKFPGARHIAISNIPHVGNKFSVARKGSDPRGSSGGPLPIPKSTVDLTDTLQDTSTSSTVPATSSTSDIRVSFQFDAKSGNYSLTQGQRIEGAPVSLIRAILERNLTSPYDMDRSSIGPLKISQAGDLAMSSSVTMSASTTSNTKPNNTVSKSKSNDVSDASRQSPPASGSGKIPHNDESIESRNLPDCPKLSSPVSSPDKKLDRQDSDETPEKDTLAVRCKLSKTTRPTFFQGNGENASAKSGNISIPLGSIDACRMKAPRGPPLPSGVVTRSQRACGTGRVDDVSRGCAVPPAPSLTAMALPSSPNTAASRRRSAAEANLKATSTVAKNKRRCSADTGPKLDNWTVVSADSSDPLSPSLAAVFTKQCSIGITRCAVATEANSHTSRFPNSAQAPILVKASTLPGIFSKTSNLPEGTTATSNCQVALSTATTVSQSVENRCQTVTVSGTDNGGKLSAKNDHHSFGQSQAENGSGTANGTGKPGWASMAVHTRCGMVALPKKVYAYLGSAMSHEHIAAREKNIDGQSSGLPCSVSVQSKEEPTNGHARSIGPDSELKRATSHTAACYLSPNDDDLESQNTAPPINQLRRMCNHFQNGSREIPSPTADVELLPPRLSPFT